MPLYLGRHGQNLDNYHGILNGHRDLPLTPLGVQQAHQLAQVIKSEGLIFDAVFTSPLLRAVNTAQIICEHLELPLPIILPDLIERNFGVMTGKPACDIERLCTPHVIKTETITYFTNADGSETFPQLFARAKLVLCNFEIEPRFHDASVLFLGHGDFGKMLYAAFYGLSWEEVLASFHFGNGELLKLERGLDPRDAHFIKQAQHNH